MKLFQQLLLAPAALGLLAPVAANAAEVNINDVASYASQPAVSAIRTTQFSDVVPGDWAYTALQNLSESYGCVDNAYTQNLKSGQALTRYEAAALVNACLDGGVASADVNSDAIRLSNEFGTEMAILKGRVDGLEYKVKELSAGQFSSSTKMDGKVTFNTGYVDGAHALDTSSKAGALTTSYVLQYNVNSSFTGKDRLYTRIKGANMDDTAWESTTYGTHLSAAGDGSNALKVDKIWYEFEVMDGFKAWVGPRIENYYMLASSPSIYKPVMKQFALGGNAATYGSSTGPGLGLAWTQQKDDRSAARFAVSTNYSAVSGHHEDGGMFTDETQSKWLSKIEYGSPKWQVSLAMAQNECENRAGTQTCKNWASYYSTEDGGSQTGDTTAYALRGYWRPDNDSAIVPDVSVGYEFGTVDDDGTEDETEAFDSWMIGLMWSDVLGDGNRLGAAFGQPQKATSKVGESRATGNASSDDDAGTPFAWEIYYDYQITDGITITPSIFGASDRYDGSKGSDSQEDDHFGALVQTTFKF